MKDDSAMEQRFVLTIEDGNVVTLPTAILKHLDVRPGERLAQLLLPEGVVLLRNPTRKERGPSTEEKE